MSKGIGSLQREILASLDDAKAACLPYRGSEAAKRAALPPPYNLPGWVWYMGTCVRLADDVYDLRASSAYLSRQRGLKVWNRDKFYPAFSRAVRSLVSRGVLVPLSLVPIQAFDSDARRLVGSLADGDYLNVGSRQLRFVRRASQAGSS